MTSLILVCFRTHKRGKKVNPKKPSDCHPITLQPNIPKVFEGLLLAQITELFECCNFFFQRQLDLGKDSMLSSQFWTWWRTFIAKLMMTRWSLWILRTTLSLSIVFPEALLSRPFWMRNFLLQLLDLSPALFVKGKFRLCLEGRIIS